MFNSAKFGHGLYENGRHSVCVPSLSAVAVLSDDASSICKNR